MSIVKKTQVELHLGGKPRVWKWNYNAIAELSEVRSATGNPIESDVSQLRAVLWAGLVWNEPKLTLQQVGDWLDESDTGVISGELSRALENSKPEEPENPTSQTPASAA